MKECANELTPAITLIINCNLELGEMPYILKRAVFRHLLKKSGLNKNDFKNYRPVSNLTSLSKLIEKVVTSSRLQEYLNGHDFGTKSQSAYKSNHSAETALLRVLYDLLRLAPQSHPTMLVLLDLSAAFDTIDKHILIKRLKSHFGVQGIALKWLTSFMSDRFMSVAVDNNCSNPQPVNFGVPQGSVLGPILFTMYTSPLSDILNEFDSGFHLYVNNTQIYLPLDIKSNAPFGKVEMCLSTIKSWMTMNKLRLNENQTEVLFITTRSLTEQQSTELDKLNFAGEFLFLPSNEVARNLGSYFHSNLNMEHHVKSYVRRAITTSEKSEGLETSLNAHTTYMLVHAFIISRLDYCNSLLVGITKFLKKRLQKIQNKAARLITRKGEDDSKTILKELHWLPIEAEIDFKIACHVYKCFHGLSPPYLSELFEEYKPSRTLRSSKSNLLLEHRSQTNVLFTSMPIKFGIASQ